MEIYSYVITHDTGFAPNPFHGSLSLATCKPKIRMTAKVGDLIVATGSAKAVGNNKLVYAGIISEIVTMEEYGVDSRFAMKKPRLKGDWFNKHGDNIYEKVGGDWKQRRNPHHFSGDIARDISGHNVLLCEQFWYFGDKAIEIPPQLYEVVKKGPGHKILKNPDIVNEFYSWLSGQNAGVQGMPDIGSDSSDQQVTSRKKGCGSGC